jgi:hypothetical protein
MPYPDAEKDLVEFTKLLVGATAIVAVIGGTVIFMLGWAVAKVTS